MLESFPVPCAKVALVDLDGTLIDKTYEVTDPTIYETIEEVQAAGWLVGLSSDTPYEALKTWRQRFRMNGPLVAEKGSLIDHAGEPVYSLAESHQYAKAYAEIRDYCEENYAVIWEGNPVEALRTSMPIGQPGDTVVLLNNQRRCSLGLFMREVDAGGHLTIDHELSDSIADSVRPLFPAFDDLEEDLNHDYGVLIVARAEVTKRRGTQHLQQVAGIGRLAMIGDSMADYLGSDIAIHYAVNNASSQLKDISDYTAKQPLTAGVVEILNGLTDIKT